MLRITIAAIALLGFTACSSGNTPSATFEPKPECIPLSEAAIEQINEGSKTTARVTKAAAVNVPGDPPLPMFTYIVAANIGDGTSNVVYLTVDDPASPGGIFAADEPAKVYFSWGEAAKYGSPAYKAGDDASTSNAADAAKNCLKQ